ncbi:MAG: VWA domain-containing protein [Chitinophagaceae bacterium]|jgi:hypothetical protein|nr:VWA domain-containing protein [Chitinophagaceae bacterium]
MNQQAYSARGITESIVAFAQFARGHGLNIGLTETQEALRAADLGLLGDKNRFRFALKSLFCHSPEECNLYDWLFTLYWDTNPTDLRDRKNETRLQGMVEKKANATLVMLGQGKSEAAEEDAKTVTGANEAERLKKADLAKISEIDAAALEKIAEKLFREMAVRLRRRMKQDRRQGQINLRRTIRRSIAFGGEPLDLLRKSRTPKRQRLVVLLDVSGSMDKYSFFLLRFICALKENFRQMDAFVFSTSLVRISRALQLRRLDLVLDVISRQAGDWSGGTRIGLCLQEFRERYGKQVLNGSPVVLVMSDGLDTGDPMVLEQQLSAIRSRCKKLIWLNPLKGMQGYQPIAKGMKTALPLVNDFRSAHNLESILELENILEDA